ncbi:LysR substrate-binding domain-containing protein [Halotalea alkalilenta]|uniref:LysR substrate-binding domain-containing protein n=1 Tax=Halotalea alkalilenta TaxID=376489 RepID=UPI00047F3AD0|nr:LysR substrate-binding domain-containing protein [Halotalea alkalilenta]
MNPRRLTPSMSLLLAFEAAARHESYTRAAEELKLSQSAVSRHVQALEQLLELKLFRREGRRIALTEVGRVYQRELSEALGQIRNASMRAISHQSGGGFLRLATLPTFGSKWLLPRLHRFYAAHPRMLVNIHSRIDAVDFHASDLDAAISVGVDHWPNLVSHRLHTERLAVIASPRLAGAKRPMAPSQLNEFLLLNVVSRAEVWGEWFEQHGLDSRAIRPGPSFELTSHLIQAVADGIGIGLVPRILVEDELREGELVSPWPSIVSRRSYYLVYPKRNQSLPALEAFRTWLEGEIADSHFDRN